MKAKETLYHEEGCFVCAECSLDLREVAVYSKDAALYCEKHYKEKFVPKCARCLDYITEVSNGILLHPCPRYDGNDSAKGPHYIALGLFYPTP